jgi:nucleotide-binding universal stress UspA family protein
MYQRIMIVVDKRAVSRAAVDEGLALAKTQDAEVLFYFSMPLYPMPLADVPPFVVVPPREYEEAAEEEADRVLSAANALAVKAGVPSRCIKGSGEDPAQGIVDAARRRRCDLVVVASQGRNAVLRLITGSVIPSLITVSPIPVLVCKQRVRSPAATRKTAAPAKARKKPIRPRRLPSARVG